MKDFTKSYSTQLKSKYN